MADYIDKVRVFVNGEKKDIPITSDLLWRPTVSESGEISWERSASTEAPASENIMGPAGPRGETGPQGAPGEKGETGPRGETGPTGATPNIQIGTVQTLEPGQDATASMTGTPENPLLNLGIPKGENGGGGGTSDLLWKPTVSESGEISWERSSSAEPPAPENITGPAGPAGPRGETGPQGPQGPEGPEGPAGQTGPTGATPNIQIGTVQTLDPGQDATASMTGTPENPLLNLGIPKGEKGDSEASHIFPNAGSHNSIFRGKNLGTQVTDAQYQAIQAGTFDDLYIGDYWVIGGVTWLIAGFDYYYGCGDTAFNKHHVVIVPLSPLYNHSMNETDTTEGGYVGSLMYTEGLERAKTQIQQAFGAEHVLSHRIYLINATSSGRPRAGGWYDSTVDIMNENMVYGCMIYTVANISTAYSVNYRVEKSQLPLFAMYPYASFNRSTFWIRDISSSSYFALADESGSANSAGASYAGGVRPAFCIGI